MEILYDRSRKKNAKGVLKEEYIFLSYKDARGEEQMLPLRRITYKDEEGRIYHFITNNFQLSANILFSLFYYLPEHRLIPKT